MPLELNGDGTIDGLTGIAPTAHKASHEDGGSDEVTLAIAQTTGLQTALDGKLMDFANMAVKTVVSGTWIEPVKAAASTRAMSDGIVWWIPIVIPVACTLDRIGVEVTTGGASSALRLGIYNASATTDKPTTVVLDAGTVASTTTGLKEITISQAISAGRYYLACVSQGGTPSAVRTAGIHNMGIARMTVMSSDSGRSGYYWVGYTGAFGTVGSTDIASNLPFVAVRIA